MQNFGLKTLILGKFKSKIEIVSTNNFLCRSVEILLEIGSVF